MAQHFFYKEIVSNPILVGGAPVAWEQLPGNRGYRVLEDGKDDALIKGLSEFASKQVGGVVKLSKDAFEDKKKALLSTPLPERRKETIQINRQTPSPLSPLPTPAKGAAPAGEPQQPGPADISQPATIGQETFPPAQQHTGFRPGTRRTPRQPSNMEKSQSLGQTFAAQPPQPPQETAIPQLPAETPAQG